MKRYSRIANGIVDDKKIKDRNDDLQDNSSTNRGGRWGKL